MEMQRGDHRDGPDKVYDILKLLQFSMPPEAGSDRCLHLATIMVKSSTTPVDPA